MRFAAVLTRSAGSFSKPAFSRFFRPFRVHSARIQSQYQRMSSSSVPISSSSSPTLATITKEIESTAFQFAHIKMPASQVFFTSKLSFASVNLKPVVPGHVLIISKRLVERVCDLENEELSDLWATGKLVGEMLQKQVKPDAFSWIIQDGPAAGQTVRHVHLHILPRVYGDFPENDEIYHRMETEGRQQMQGTHVDEENRPPRSAEEMAREAVQFRQAMAELLDAKKQIESTQSQENLDLRVGKDSKL